MNVGSTVHIVSRFGNTILGTVLSYDRWLVELQIVHPLAGGKFERRAITLDISDATEYPYVKVTDPIAKRFYENSVDFTSPHLWAIRHQNQHSKRFTFFDNSELIHYTSRKSIAWGNGKEVFEEKQAA